MRTGAICIPILSLRIDLEIPTGRDRRQRGYAGPPRPHAKAEGPPYCLLK